MRSTISWEPVGGSGGREEMASPSMPVAVVRQARPEEAEPSTNISEGLVRRLRAASDNQAVGARADPS